jgi:hypothetical protein
MAHALKMGMAPFYHFRPKSTSPGKMAELVQGVRLRFTLTPNIGFLISFTGRGFESHSCHVFLFCFLFGPLHQEREL